MGISCWIVFWVFYFYKFSIASFVADKGNCSWARWSYRRSSRSSIVNSCMSSNFIKHRMLSVQIIPRTYVGKIYRSSQKSLFYIFSSSWEIFFFSWSFRKEPYCRKNIFTSFKPCCLDITIFNFFSFKEIFFIKDLKTISRSDIKDEIYIPTKYINQVHNYTIRNVFF